MAKGLMMVWSEPNPGISHEEYRRWYDDHIDGALAAVPGMPRAVRYRVSGAQAPGVASEFEFVTLYEIDTDDIGDLQRELANAWKDGRLTRSDAIMRSGLTVFWETDAVFSTTAEPSDAPPSP